MIILSIKYEILHRLYCNRCNKPPSTSVSHIIDVESEQKNKV